MTVRQTLADALTPLVPTTFRIIPHADSLDRIDTGQHVLMLYRGTVRPTAAGTFGHLDNEMVLWLLSSYLDPGPADDDLDTALDTLLFDGLDALTFVTWSEAERGTWGEQQYHGYRVTATVTTSKE